MLYANKVPKCVPPGCLNTLNPSSARKSPKPNNLLKIKTAKWIGFHVLECVPKNTSRNMLFQSIFDAGEIASMQFGDFPVESDYQYFLFRQFSRFSTKENLIPIARNSFLSRYIIYHISLPVKQPVVTISGADNHPFRIKKVTRWVWRVVSLGNFRIAIMIIEQGWIVLVNID